MALARKLLREPLVQFLLLGALLFVLLRRGRAGGPGRGTTRITITPGLVEHLASGFARTWQQPPTDEELKGLIDEHVKEEIATREAVAMGLDEDDTIIRRRLRQKLEFLVEGAADQVPPTRRGAPGVAGEAPRSLSGRAAGGAAPGLRGARSVAGPSRGWRRRSSSSALPKRPVRARRSTRWATRPCCRTSCRSAPSPR